MASAAASAPAPAGIPTKEELKKKLSAAAYYVTQEKGTERPWTSELNSVKDKGTFKCVVCDTPLFETEAKFDSGCGWPSFFKPLTPGALAEHSDRSHGMVRTEVTCSKCGAHMGHVFDDGPRDKTGLRYCINGVALNFEKKK